MDGVGEGGLFWRRGRRGGGVGFGGDERFFVGDRCVVGGGGGWGGG